MDLDLTQKLTTAEKARSAKTIKNMKQQVSYERHLKLDAFHEVDKLISQVSNTLLYEKFLCYHSISFYWVHVIAIIGA